MSQPEPFDLAVSQGNGKVFLRIRGALDGKGAHRIQDVLKHLQGTAGDCLLSVDLSDRADFDYFGVVHLVKAIRDNRGRFRQVTVTGLNSSAQTIFKRFGLENGKSFETVLSAERFAGGEHRGKHPGHR